MTAKWQVDASLILGDLNADCAYISKDAMSKEVRLRTDNRFHWLIPDGNATSVNTDCAYDRIIVEDKYLSAVVKGTAKVDYYHRRLSTRWLLFQVMSTGGIRDVSDHFPIGVMLTTRPRKWRAKKSAPTEAEKARPGTSVVTLKTSSGTKERSEPSKSAKAAAAKTKSTATSTGAKKRSRPRKSDTSSTAETTSDPDYQEYDTDASFSA